MGYNTMECLTWARINLKGSSGKHGALVTVTEATLASRYLPGICRGAEGARPSSHFPPPPQTKSEGAGGKQHPSGYMEEHPANTLAAAEDLKLLELVFRDKEEGNDVLGE